MARTQPRPYQSKDSGSDPKVGPKFELPTCSILLPIACGMVQMQVEKCCQKGTRTFTRPGLLKGMVVIHGRDLKNYQFSDPIFLI